MRLLNHLEIYSKIIELPGDVLEFGVYKGSSLVQHLSFRDLLENQYFRKIYGFDFFGKSLNSLSFESDRKFVKKFQKAGGYGIRIKEL